MKEKVSVLDIKNNLKDYKVCRNCWSYNLRENIKCHKCDIKGYQFFDLESESVLKAINEEIKFQVQEKELTESELIQKIVSVSYEDEIL